MCAKSVNGLGREGDEPARAEDFRSAFDGPGLRRMRIDLDDVVHTSPPVQDPIGPICFTVASVAQAPKSEKYDFCGSNELAPNSQTTDRGLIPRQKVGNLQGIRALPHRAGRGDVQPTLPSSKLNARHQPFRWHLGCFNQVCHEIQNRTQTK